MNLVARLQAINQKLMYTDRMTVYRQVPVIDEQGADDFELRPVHEDIPCRLSQSQKARLSIGESTAESTQQLKIFTAPDIKVLANDSIKVFQKIDTNDGLIETIYNLRAALPFRYLAQQEIPVDVDESAKEEVTEDEAGGL